MLCLKFILWGNLIPHLGSSVPQSFASFSHPLSPFPAHTKKYFTVIIPLRLVDLFSLTAVHFHFSGMHWFWWLHTVRICIWWSFIMTKPDFQVAGGGERRWQWGRWTFPPMMLSESLCGWCWGDWWVIKGFEGWNSGTTPLVTCLYHL